MVSILVFVLMCGELDVGCLNYKAVNRIEPIERCEEAVRFINSDIHRARFRETRPYHFAFCAIVGLNDLK